MIPSWFCTKFRNFMHAQKYNSNGLWKVTNQEIEQLFRGFEIIEKRKDVYHLTD